MGITFEVRARIAKQNEEDVVSYIALLSAIANLIQANGTCIVGYIASPGLNETDDEGGANVEDTLNERTPLINGSRKSSRTGVAS
jgi:hypothetical protein